MRMSIAALACAIMMPVPGKQAHAQQAFPLPQTDKYSQKTLLKNFTLSVCLAQVAQDERTAKDAGLTASAYMEFGRQDAQAYDALRKMATKYAHLKYGGSVESDYNTMKCIDLLYSKELDRLTDKLIKKK